MCSGLVGGLPEGRELAGAGQVQVLSKPTHLVRVTVTSLASLDGGSQGQGGTTVALAFTWQQASDTDTGIPTAQVCLLLKIWKIQKSMKNKIKISSNPRDTLYFFYFKTYISHFLMFLKLGCILCMIYV